MQIKAIETQYKGYRFRSRLEARWAVTFDRAKIQYQYEPEGYDLPGVGKYLPDFFLPDFDTIVEVKPLVSTYQRRFYLAGKIDGDPWRDDLLTASAPQEWTSGLEIPMIGNHICVGPYLVERDSDRVTHGQFDSNHGAGEGIVGRCLEAIDRADAVLVWWNGTETIGTMVETGYAKAKGKPIYCAYPYQRYPPWFLAEVSTQVTRHNSPQDAFLSILHSPALIRTIPELSEPIRKLSVLGEDHQCLLLAGSPGDEMLFSFVPDYMRGYYRPQTRELMLIMGSSLWGQAMNDGKGARFEFGESGAQ